MDESQLRKYYELLTSAGDAAEAMEASDGIVAVSVATGRETEIPHDYMLGFMAGVYTAKILALDYLVLGIGEFTGGEVVRDAIEAYVRAGDDDE